MYCLLLLALLKIISVSLIGISDDDTNIGYIWHVTDFHYDPTYNVTSLSCKTNEDDIVFGTFGNIWCDAPWALVKSSIQAMRSFKPDVDFILWTGDTILHLNPENINHQMNVDIFNNVTNLLKSTFAGTPVYPSFGNHDTDLTDQFKPRNTLLYNQAWSRWRSWINDDTQEATCRKDISNRSLQSRNKGGYYTVKASPYLRVIVLNTILYYKRNKQVTSDGDPAGQFRWLVEALQYARKQKEKVIITAHIPLGVQPNGDTELYKHQNDRIIEISNNYSDVIVAMHFGHEHTDAFKVLTDEKGVPTVPIFLAPSVTPLGYSLSHNPGIRLIKYNRITGLHLEIIQYYLDVEAANIAGTASWELEYSTSGAYGIKNLSPGSLFSLINRMKAADSQEFKSFWNHYVVTPPRSLFKKCDSKCHARVFCGFTKLTESDFAKCLQEFDADNIQKFWRWFFRR